MRAQEGAAETLTKKETETEKETLTKKETETEKERGVTGGELHCVGKGRSITRTLRSARSS